MKQLAKALAIFGAGSLIGTIAQVAKGKIGAILLGVSGVGVVSQLTNAWSFAYTLSGLGFYNGVVQRIAQAESNSDQLALGRQLSTSLIFLAIFSLALAIIGVVISPLISELIFADGGARSGLVALTLLSVPFAVTVQTYQGLLSGCRLIKPIVTVQVISDLAGLALFAGLVFYANLLGAVIAFSSINVIKLCLQIIMVKRVFGTGRVVPRLSDFHWKEVRINIGYGVNGLIMVALGIATILLVSRWIIHGIGMSANGIFSAAWKVSALYLGALYASAGGYYFPALSACKSNRELVTAINEAVLLYMYAIPPLIIIIIVGGELLTWAIFSKSFTDAARLLVFLLPGDLFRVLAETIGLSFLARRRLVAYTSTYIIWAGMFLLLAATLLPRMGLVGVAYAYLASHVVHAGIVIFIARRTFNFRFDRASYDAILVGILAIFSTVLAVSFLSSWQYRYGAGCLVLGGWLGLTWRDPSFRDLMKSAIMRLRRI